MVSNVCVLGGVVKSTPPWGTFVNLWRYLVVILEGCLCVEVKDVAKHPTVHRAVPTTETYPAQDINSAEVGTLKATE